MIGINTLGAATLGGTASLYGFALQAVYETDSQVIFSFGAPADGQPAYGDDVTALFSRYTDAARLAELAFVSIFTDKRLADGMQDDRGDDDKRGWWADTYNRDGYKIGSYLWTLEGRVINDELLEQAAIYMKDCMSWMIDEGLITGIEAAAERSGKDTIAAVVHLTRDNASGVTLKYNSLWG